MQLKYDFDYVVIGSGFGGSVSAMRLAEKGYDVLVLEKGKRFTAADFAKTSWNLRKYLWLPVLKCFGIQNLSLFKNVLILSGVGVGGGSLVYANTLLEPGDSFYNAENWAGLADWKRELSTHYLTAKKMLGVTTNPLLTEPDYELKKIADEMGRGHTFKSVDVGVFFGEKGSEGKSFKDPYFGGTGPDRRACNFCGGCMVGCRFDAKNTLDKNYLYFAEKRGAQIRPESEVVNVEPIHNEDKSIDGSAGYEITVERSTSWFQKKRHTIKARGVIFSAGVLGTVSLLLKLRDQKKSLTAISKNLGSNVRTNSEALLGVTTRNSDRDFSKGIAITSGFYADDVTHIEPVRYSKGSSFMKTLAAPMADDGGRVTRPLKMLLASIVHPIDTLRLLVQWSSWAERTVILLVMQTLDNKMEFRLGRNLFTGFRKKMTTKVDTTQKVPSYIAIGHVIARKLSTRLNAIPQSAVNEVVLQIPTTAHILGGCGIGKDASTGVVDSKQQVFGYKNMLVCDGSVIPANLGVNPSLTITAMTERAMGFIPNKIF